MNSLRSRLIVGFALVAVIPLVVALYLLSRRVESMVRTDAAARLNAAIGGLQSELGARRAETEEKLRILSRDPVLKRFYLVRSTGRRELNEHLAERRFLLGLDFLQVADTSGMVMGDGSDRAVEPVPDLALSAAAPIVYDGRTVGTLRGGSFLDADFLARLKRTGGMELVLHDEAGRGLASTLPGQGHSVPAQPDVRRVTIDKRSYLGRSYPLEIGPGTRGSITGLVPTTAAEQTITGLRLTAGVLALVGLVIAVLLGVLWSSQISRPVERLAAYSRRLARGDWEEPLDLRSVRELETLVEALDQMRNDLVTYRAKLVTSERQAAWSQMARKVAHEVKNPLTPIAVSVADLKRSFDQQRPDFPAILDQAVRTIASEVDSLKRLLQEFADFARFPAPRLGPCDLSSLLADIRTLYAREIGEGRLAINPPLGEITLQADADQVRQALVNLVKNGLEAIDGNGQVSITAQTAGTELLLEVSDTGPGMTEEQRANLFTPGFTTKTHGSGLGLTIVQRIVSDHGGFVSAESRAGGGTTFRVRLPIQAS